MSHKADKSWFQEKRSWSKRKDAILEYYLKPYLAKIATLRKPILLVDGFAGPGLFGDGEPGSPLLLCSKAIPVIRQGAAVNVACVESDPDLFERLDKNLEKFEFAKAYAGSFSNFLPEIEKRVPGTSVFLYIDPFAIEGIEWTALDTVMKHMSNPSVSIELLMNFNSPAFVRRGLAALKMSIPETSPDEEDSDDFDIGADHSPSVLALDNVVGGDWWQEVLRGETEYGTQIQKIVEGFHAKLRSRFKEVCYVPIKAKEHDDFPKYHMIFASRSPDALELMNDAMLKVTQDGLVTLDLFASVDLPALILREANDSKSRGGLIVDVIREAFCRFLRKDVRKCIEDLLKKGLLRSETGKSRIKDSVKVWRVDRPS